jgi:hypothetical protein
MKSRGDAMNLTPFQKRLLPSGERIDGLSRKTYREAVLEKSTMPGLDNGSTKVLDGQTLRKSPESLSPNISRR